MIVRELLSSDLEELKRIHEKFYKNEFYFPNFNNNFLGAFVITTDDNEIIVAAGVRPIAESLAITNKDMSTKQRIKGLNKVLEVSSFICSHSGFDQLHAFVQDENWKRQLIKSGFSPCKGDALYLNV